MKCEGSAAEEGQRCMEGTSREERNVALHDSLNWGKALFRYGVQAGWSRVQVRQARRGHACGGAPSCSAAAAKCGQLEGAAGGVMYKCWAG